MKTYSVLFIDGTALSMTAEDLTLLSTSIKRHAFDESNIISITFIK